MQRFMLVFVFAFGLFLKVATVAGAELEFGPGTLLASNETNLESDAVVSDADSNASLPDIKADTRTDTRADTRVETKAEPKSSRIQNTINVSSPPQASYSQGPYYDASSVLTARRHDDEDGMRFALIPLIGGTSFSGQWNQHISNSYTAGLALETPISKMVTIEVEGDYAKYNIAYSYYGHSFDQYSIGGNAKFYLSRSVIQPYIGGGLMGINYSNMTHGPSYPLQYSQWLGAMQAIAGADVQVAEKVAIGIRGAYVVPVFNRPATIDNGYNAYPGYEEASAMNTTFFRFMGTAKISF